MDRQLDALRQHGVTNIVMVVGYKRQAIEEHIRRHHPDLAVRCVVNQNFETTNTLFSLRDALPFCEGDFLYLNGDVVFDPGVLRRLLDERDGGCLAVDRKQCREEEVKVMVQDGTVVDIGKHLDPKKSYGEFIGVAKFSGSFAEAFRQQVAAEAKPGNEMQFFEYALHTMADKSWLVAIDITGLPCVEVDFAEDYTYAIDLFERGEGANRDADL